MEKEYQLAGWINKKSKELTISTNHMVYNELIHKLTKFTCTSGRESNSPSQLSHRYMSKTGGWSRMWDVFWEQFLRTKNRRGLFSNPLSYSCNVKNLFLRKDGQYVTESFWLWVFCHPKHDFEHDSSEKNISTNFYQNWTSVNLTSEIRINEKSQQLPWKLIYKKELFIHCYAS